MIRSKILFATFLIVLLTISSSFAYPILEVYLPDYEVAINLISEGYDIISIENDIALVKGWERDIARLQTNGYSYEVYIEDFIAYTKKRIGTDLDEMGGYLTLSEIDEWTSNLIENHPDIVSDINIIGYSHEYRQLKVIKISDNPNVNETDETEIFINAGIHADEVAGPFVVMNFCDYLVSNYGDDQRITDIINQNEIWIQTVMNPDSYYYNEVVAPDGGGGQRMNMNGVDLNRNWPFMWLENRYEYYGEYPGSEREVASVMNFINRNHFSTIINYHACGNVLLIPWSYCTLPHPDYLTYMNYGKYVNETLGYHFGGPENMYTIPGGAQDWQAAGGLENGADYPMLSFLFEVGSRYENGEMVGHWPSYGMALTYAEAHLEPLLRLCDFASDPSVLTPPSSTEICLEDTVSNVFPISWNIPDSTSSIVDYTYDIAKIDSLFFFDGAENLNSKAWEMNGFSFNPITRYEGEYGYRSGDSLRSALMTTIIPYIVQENDTLQFMVKYDLLENRHYAYVEISFDRITFSSLEGNITTNELYGEPFSLNKGNGITGLNYTWTRATFPLDQYEGTMVYFRISCYGFFLEAYRGIFIDNISPIPSFTSFDVLETNIIDTFFIADFSEINDITTCYFTCKVENNLGISSAWSMPKQTVILPGSLVENKSNIPLTFSVSEVYPNPFNPSTSVRMTIPDRSNVSIVMHDILGREVRTVMHSAVEAGAHTYSVDASDLASGLYFLVVNAKGENGINHRAVKKAILMK